MVKLANNEEWAQPIGRIFLAFGSIEHGVFLAIRDIPESKVWRSAIKMPFAARIELLTEIVEAIEGQPYVDLVETLNQIKALAKRRNIPAHNALVVDFYESEAGKFVMNQIISSPHNAKHKLTLDEVIAIANSAEFLSHEIYKRMAEIRLFKMQAAK